MRIIRTLDLGLLQLEPYSFGGSVVALITKFSAFLEHIHIILTCRGAGAKAAAVPARARRVKVFMVYSNIDIELYPLE